MPAGLPCGHTVCLAPPGRVKPVSWAPRRTGPFPRQFFPIEEFSRRSLFVRRDVVTVAGRFYKVVYGRQSRGVRARAVAGLILAVGPQRVDLGPGVIDVDPEDDLAPPGVYQRLSATQVPDETPFQPAEVVLDPVDFSPAAKLGEYVHRPYLNQVRLRRLHVPLYLRPLAPRPAIEITLELLNRSLALDDQHARERDSLTAHDSADDGKQHSSQDAQDRYDYQQLNKAEARGTVRATPPRSNRFALAHRRPLGLPTPIGQ